MKKANKKEPAPNVSTKCRQYKSLPKTLIPSEERHSSPDNTKSIVELLAASNASIIDFDPPVLSGVMYHPADLSK